jgi:peptide/nickel transport system ATP-binding protein/oligopeptide transport system ATP-binding protein
MEASPAQNGKMLISIRDLVKYYPIRGGFLQHTVAHVKAVDHISFDIREGETFGLVGESGCGKTTVGRTILRLTPATSGQALFDGKDVFRMNKAELKKVRRDMQIVFQDPFGSLDPRKPIGDIIGEGLVIHGIGNKKERADHVADIMRKVGLRPEYERRYPHEFSGGQRQRIGIARALILNPRFVVCDEPVSALDVSIQSQVLNLLKHLQRQFHLTYLFIAHNLSVVKYISDRVGVMYLGKMAEIAPSQELYDNPLHPYTKALVAAIPLPDPSLKRKRAILTGDVPSPVNPPSGCRFHTRCPIAQLPLCKEKEPDLREVTPGHFAACHAIGNWA